MKKPGDVRGSAGVAHRALVEAVCQEYATLGEYLTAVTYDDGEARETATLTIFLGSGVLTAALKDRATGRIGWVSSTSLLSLLESLEEHLRTDSLEWRIDRAAPPRRPGR